MHIFKLITSLFEFYLFSNTVLPHRSANLPTVTRRDEGFCTPPTIEVSKPGCQGSSRATTFARLQQSRSANLVTLEDAMPTSFAHLQQSRSANLRYGDPKMTINFCTPPTIEVSKPAQHNASGQDVFCTPPTIEVSRPRQKDIDAWWTFCTPPTIEVSKPSFLVG